MTGRQQRGVAVVVAVLASGSALLIGGSSGPTARRSPSTLPRHAARFPVEPESTRPGASRPTSPWVVRPRTRSAEVAALALQPAGSAPGSRRRALEDAGVAFMGDLEHAWPEPLATESIAMLWEDEDSLPDESEHMWDRYERALEDLAIDGRVKEADCRQSACRVSMWFGSGEESTRFQALAVEDREGVEIRIDAIGEWPSLDGELNVQLFVPTDH